VDRVFLDANVLFSVAYLQTSKLAGLWRLENVQLISSSYAIEEARRNLAIKRKPAVPRLAQLIEALDIVDTPQHRAFSQRVRLHRKDQPILLAAIHPRADYLLTGDAQHFSHLFGKRIEGVLVLQPAQYLSHRTAN
jgi:predicted nucleic acid-binding protein